MTKPSAVDRRRSLRRAADRERSASRVLGVRRVWRAHGESAPDLEAVEVRGVVLQPEIKTRAALPAYLARALEQARRYNPDAEPLAVISARCGRALAVIDLRTFALLVGLEIPMELPRPRRRKHVEPQLALFASDALTAGAATPPAGAIQKRAADISPAEQSPNGQDVRGRDHKPDNEVHTPPGPCCRHH